MYTPSVHFWIPAHSDTSEHAQHLANSPPNCWHCWLWCLRHTNAFPIPRLSRAIFKHLWFLRHKRDSTGFSPSNSPDFSLGKNPIKRGKYLVPPWKTPVKNTGFSPRYSAPKRHCSLFLRTFLCRNTHVPTPRLGPALMVLYGFVRRKFLRSQYEWGNGLLAGVSSLHQICYRLAHDILTFFQSHDWS